MINLRESILTNRIRQTTQATSSDYDESNYLSKALGGLQRYFFLLCFTAYVNESPNTKFEKRFSSWVRARTEIWAMLQNMRRKGPRLYMFRPVEDLHHLVQPASHHRFSSSRAMMSSSKGMFDMTSTASQSNANMTVEMEEFVINVSLYILFIDFCFNFFFFYTVSYRCSINFTNYFKSGFLALWILEPTR